MAIYFVVDLEEESGPATILHKGKALAELFFRDTEGHVSVTASEPLDGLVQVTLHDADEIDYSYKGYVLNGVLEAHA